MNTTYAEILEMRRKLDEALRKKTNLDKLAHAFDVEISGRRNNQIGFFNAYHCGIASIFCVDGEFKPTPQEAFDSALKAINAVDYRKPTKEDKIKALRDQIAKLENEQ